MTVEQLVVTLQSVRGIGDRAVHAILRGMAVHGLRPDELVTMTADQYQAAFDLPSAQASALARCIRSAAARADEIVRRMHQVGITTLIASDAAYPQRLLSALEHPPAAIYCRGNAALLRQPFVALGNSNQTPPPAMQHAVAAMSAAVECGFTVVTGHNRAEYQQAALAACRLGAPCCYVLDRGIMELPAAVAGTGLFAGARIWRDPAEASRDLVLSGCAPAMPAVQGSNRRRDAMVLGLASVILCSHARSGGNMEQLMAACTRTGTAVAWVAEQQPPTSLMRSLPELAIVRADSLKEWLCARLREPR